MATFTLSANSTFASLGATNNDTVNCNGFALTIGVAPSQTGIIVNSPATAGTVIISGAWNLSTWSFTAGTVTMISSVPAGCTVGSVNGGAVANAAGCGNNYGNITTVNGGSASATYGVVINTQSGIITTANAGSVSAANAVNNNNGTVTTANGGSVAGAHGVNNNNGTVTTANGGSVATSYGISINNSNVLQLTDATANAVNTWGSGAKFVLGPGINGTIKAPVTLIYSRGVMNPAAILPAGVTVITMVDSPSLNDYLKGVQVGQQLMRAQI